MMTLLTILMYFISTVVAMILGTVDPKKDPTGTLFWLGTFVLFFIMASVMIWL